MTTTTLPSADFKRTPFTWLTYALFGLFAFGLSLPGPMMPFIGEQLGLTYTQMGLHFTMNAAGNLLVGLYGDRVVDRFGDKHALMIGMGLSAVALVGLTFGPLLAITLTAATLYGIGLGIITVVVNNMVVVAHPQNQSKAFAEGNIIAGTGVVLGPLTVGQLAGSGLGWQQIALVFGTASALLLFILANTRFPHNEQTEAQAASNARLPLLYWVYGGVLFLCFAIEWLTISWSADFLSNVVGYSPATAATMVSVFAVAIVVGRVLGWRLLNRIPARRLLVLAFGVVVLAFPVYWLSPVPWLNVAGLFVMGLGASNLFPLSLDAAMRVGAVNTARASARVSLFAGLSLVTLPQLVGTLADSMGIGRAYAVLGVVAVLGLMMAMVATTMERRMAA